MAPQENKALVRRFFEEIVNQGNLAVAEELFPAEMVEDEQQTAAMWRTAFPDIQITVEDMIAEGDKVAARLTIRGTHLGEIKSARLGNIPPTGRQATWAGIDIAHIANGKIVERWTPRDLLGLLQQLGLISPPGQ